MTWNDFMRQAHARPLPPMILDDLEALGETDDPVEPPGKPPTIVRS